MSFLTRSSGLIAAAALALALGGAPASACACGIALEATVSEERALVVERPGAEEIVLSLDLASDPGARAAVVVPVPGEPEVAAIEGGEDPLAYLEEATAPAAPVAPLAAGGGDDAAAPVDVIGREQIGGYDVARLRAADPEALDRWLTENGYALPPGAASILADYVERGWSYVAIRLAPGSEGALEPLRIGFDTDRLVYPMRLAQLGTVPLELTLFVLAESERSVPGLETSWAGSTAELDPQPPAELERLFAEGRFVTRLEASADPAAFTEDLLIEPAGGTTLAGGPASPAPLGGTGDGSASAPAIVAIGLAGLALIVVLGFVARGSRERRPT